MISTVLCTFSVVLRYYCVILFFTWFGYEYIQAQLYYLKRLKSIHWLQRQKGIHTQYLYRYSAAGTSSGARPERGSSSYLPDGACPISVAWYLPQMLRTLPCRFGSNSPGYTRVPQILLFWASWSLSTQSFGKAPATQFCEGLKDLCQMHRIPT